MKAQQTWFHLFEMIVLGGGIGWGIARVLDPDPVCPTCPVCGGGSAIPVAGGAAGAGGGDGSILLSGNPNTGVNYAVPLDTGTSAMPSASSTSPDQPASVTYGSILPSSGTAPSSASISPSSSPFASTPASYGSLPAYTPGAGAAAGSGAYSAPSAPPLSPNNITTMNIAPSGGGAAPLAPLQTTPLQTTGVPSPIRNAPAAVIPIAGRTGVRSRR